MYGGIYASSSYGKYWESTQAPLSNWTSITSDSSGQFLAAASTSGIYISTSNVTKWSITTAPQAEWSAVASSSDGSLLVATVYGGGIYISYSSSPTSQPTSQPTLQPTVQPTSRPTSSPSCSLGSVGTAGGNLGCNSCEPGYYADSWSTKVCQPCPVNTFTAEHHSAFCQICNYPYKTRWTASINCTYLSIGLNKIGGALLVVFLLLQFLYCIYQAKQRKLEALWLMIIPALDILSDILFILYW